MNYTRPEIVVLGEAKRMIGFLIAIKGYIVFFDIPLMRINPAYDLDE